MMLGALASSDANVEPRDTDAGQRPARRVLALCECGRSGPAVLAEAATLITESACELTVVAVAPQDTDPPCCAVYVDAFNRGVRDDAVAALHEAKQLLGPQGERARFELLVEGRDPPLEALVATGSIDLVLLPARRGLSHVPRHPLERRLRRSTDAEVRVVSGPAKSANTGSSDQNI